MKVCILNYGVRDRIYLSMSNEVYLTIKEVAGYLIVRDKIFEEAVSPILFKYWGPSKESGISILKPPTEVFNYPISIFVPARG